MSPTAASPAAGPIRAYTPAPRMTPIPDKETCQRRSVRRSAGAAGWSLRGTCHDVAYVHVEPPDPSTCEANVRRTPDEQK